MKQWIEFDPATGEILAQAVGTDVIAPEETGERGILMDAQADARTHRVNPVSREVELKPS